MDMIQNSSPHESINCEPHEVIMGCPMPTHFDWEARTDLSKPMEARERLNRGEAQERAKLLQS